MAKLWLAYLAAFTAAAAPQSSGPRLLNTQELVTANDYPLVSLRNDEDGRVRVKVQFDESGLVTSCKVIQSSGHTALDEQTCALFRSRARFEPKTDASGRARKSDFTQTIVWQLAGPKAAPSPRHAWTASTTLSLSKSGRIIGCKVQSTGIDLPPQVCEAVVAVAKTVLGADSGSGAGSEPVAASMISEVYFYPVGVEKAPEPPRVPGAKEMGRQVSAVTIAPDGSLKACRGVRFTGAASPERDECETMRNERFEPARNSRDLEATVVSTIYLQIQSVT